MDFRIFPLYAVEITVESNINTDIIVNEFFGKDKVLYLKEYKKYKIAEINTPNVIMLDFMISSGANDIELKARGVTKITISSITKEIFIKMFFDVFV